MEIHPNKGRTGAACALSWSGSISTFLELGLEIFGDGGWFYIVCCVVEKSSGR